MLIIAIPKGEALDASKNNACESVNGIGSKSKCLLFCLCHVVPVLLYYNVCIFLRSRLPAEAINMAFVGLRA